MSACAFLSIPLSLWKCRWAIIRVVIVLTLLWAIILDNPERGLRLQMAELPDFNYVLHMQMLREEGRFGEALVVGETGRQELEDDQLSVLNAEISKTIDERDSYWRKGKEFAYGAASGEAQSVESLIGSVLADIIVIGDIRDLIVQGSKKVTGQESDEMLMALSAIGLVTTFTPQFDWGVSVLKGAKRAGRISAKFIARITTLCKRAIKTRDLTELVRITDHLYIIGKHASPAGTVRVLEHVDDPTNLGKLAKFCADYRDGAFTLQVAGKQGVEGVIKRTTLGELADLRMAAKKGPPGLAVLSKLKKSAYYGSRFGKVSRRVNQYLGGWVAIVLTIWIFGEFCLIVRRLLPRLRFRGNSLSTSHVH